MEIGGDFKPSFLGTKMKKLIFLLGVMFLLVGCSSSIPKRYEIQKSDGNVEYVTADNVWIEKDGALNFRACGTNGWTSVAIYPRDTYKSCAVTE